MKKAPHRNTIAEWAGTLLIMLFATATVAQPFVVPTGSMEDTVLIGDHMIVDKLAYAPAGNLARHVLPYREVKRGDIIVFRYPVDINETYVKRVIGVPGDRVRIFDQQVYVNGKPLPEPYKVHKAGYKDSFRDFFPSAPNVRLYEPALRMLRDNVVNGEVLVPPGNCFAMGDNRDNSADSRYWGFVPRENIIGKPVIIYWSYDAPTERLADPNINVDHLVDLGLNFFSKTRWRRTFQPVRGYAHP